MRTATSVDNAAITSQLKAFLFCQGGDDNNNSNNIIMSHRPRKRPRRQPCLVNTTAAAPAPAAAAAADSASEPFTLKEDHRVSVVKTTSHVIKNFPEYRNRMEEIMNWFKEQYPEYYDKVVFPLTPEMKADPTRHYYKATRDFRYHLLVAPPMMAWLSHGKKWKNKEKGTVYGHSHLGKYHQAVKLGADYSGGSKLTQQYVDEMDAYMDNMKREKAEAKQNNQIEEKDADPIGIDLYQQICHWALDDGTSRGITVWASAVTQWNCMGRPINIDAIGFHNMKKSPGLDSVVISYDKNKKDQHGKKVSPKNCYANPLKPHISFFLAMGCYLAINQDRYDRDKDKIFVKAGKDGSASDTYQKGLKELLADPKKREKIMDSIREGHFHAYGMRKGSATLVATGTGDPPPITSIMLRGEWNLGGSLDVYWFFSLVGDCYVGRVLAGFDPDGEDIAMLPPHFKEGMGNKFINEAMELTFGGILKRYRDMTSCLLLFLASIVYHQSFLRQYFEKNSKHPFNDIALLHRPELLEEVSALVTFEPCGEVTQATGVPRYNKLLKLLRQIVEGNAEAIELVQREVASIPRVVRESIDTIAAEAGNVTAPMVMNLLEGVADKIRDNVKEVVRTEMAAAYRELREELPPPPAAIATNAAPSLNLNRGNAGMLFQTFSYIDLDAKGKRSVNKQQEFVVPSDFNFPSPLLRNAWQLWFYGLTDNVSSKADGSRYSAPVKPFRLIEPRMLPQKKRKHFNDCWRPILEYMENAVKEDGSVALSSRYPSAQTINDAYEVAQRVMKQEHPDLFSNKAHGSWKVANWSKELRKSRRKRKLQD